jgi:hypothetical protein
VVSTKCHEFICAKRRFVYPVGFEVLTAVSTRMAVFWVVAPCSLVEDYTALQLRRQPSFVYLALIFKTRSLNISGSVGAAVAQAV